MSAENLLKFSDIRVYSICKALEDSINISDFRCENEDFNYYLLNTALEDDKKNIGKVFLFTTYDKKVVGFLTLAMSQVKRLEHETLRTVTTTQDYIPGILLGHIARHIEYRGRGLSRRVGCRLIILQAFDNNLVEMYRRWGFLPVDDFDEAGRRKNVYRFIMAFTKIKGPPLRRITKHFPTTDYIS